MQGIRTQTDADPTGIARTRSELNRRAAAWIARCLALAVLAGATSARAEIVRLDVHGSEAFAGGQSFGAAGAYRRTWGVAHGEIDPRDPTHAAIADLERAPRNATGQVEYAVDFFLLHPERVGSTLLYDVPNRGSKVALSFLNEARVATAGEPGYPRDAADVGNGFLLRRGYTLVWSGWEPLFPKRPGALSAELPAARGIGPQRIRDEFVFGIFPGAVPDFAPLSHPTADLDPAGARLTVRERQGDPRRELPSSSWRFLDSRRIALVPDGLRFAPAAIYDFWYRAGDPKVLGVGFAATRDLVSFLRNEPADRGGRPNPLARSGALPARALAFGVSQSGRFLRHFLELGMNRDARGRRVFDGLLPYIGGAGKVFANHRFGQPGRTAGQHIGRDFPENWFPFAHARLEDPLTRIRAGLLRGDESDPLVIEVNTSTEYWQKGASLLHTEPHGRRDLTPPAGVRLFLIAGTEHAGGAIDRSQTCANPGNPHRPAAALRALLVALDEWVSDGREPPASRIPKLADGSLVELQDWRFPRIPGAGVAPRMNRIRPPVDWVDPPASDAGPFYAARVPAVDTDGNERAGVALPPVAVPLGTYTGWNVFREGYPTGDLCGRSGSFLAFAPTPQARAEIGDPRASILERYPTRADYVARVEAAAHALADERLLLAEDVSAYVQRARRADGPWDAPAKPD